MARPARVPERGDIAKALVAIRLGLSVADFDARRNELEKRGFPIPDETTGMWCIEAIDRWRLRRYAKLFPELTLAPSAVDASAVFEERLGRLSGAS